MSKTIVALDFSSKEEVVDFLKQFDEPVYVKIGMELTYACGLNGKNSEGNGSPHFLRFEIA